MKRAALAFSLCLWAGPALAYSLEDATTCAAFSMANWDFEVEKFAPEDVAPEWKAQAGGFVLVAERLGQDRATTNKLINAQRGPLLELIKGYIYTEDRAQARQFKKISRTCGRIFKKAPEMAPYK